MKTSRQLLLAIMVCSLLAALAGSAVGQGAGGPVAACGSYADKPGDVSQKNLDIIEFWFATKGAKTTANLRVADLSDAIPADATGVNWYVLWNVDDVQYYVTARVDAIDGGPFFEWGMVVDNGANTLRQGQAETVGKFYPGPNGVIEWTVPAEAGAKSGGTLATPIADTTTSTGYLFSLLTTIDEASGKTYTVAPCPSGSADPAPTAAPGATPAPTPSGQQPTTTQTGAAGQLDAKLTGKVPAAKKVKKSLALTLKSGKGATGVKATLYAGDIKANKVVATGSASKVAKKTTLKLKVTKKLKKGKYTLYLAGKNADGQTADRKIALKLK